VITDPVGTLAVGYDNNHQIVWTSISQVQAPIAALSDNIASFPDIIGAWQWHRLCQIQFVLDPKSSILTGTGPERDLTAQVGMCEAVPGADLEPSDLPDLVATLDWNGKELQG
jgi:hypothetical protein